MIALAKGLSSFLFYILLLSVAVTTEPDCMQSDGKFTFKNLNLLRTYGLWLDHILPTHAWVTFTNYVETLDGREFVHVYCS